MDRRTVLKTVSLVLGGSLSAGTMTAILSGCQPNNRPDWTPQFFPKERVAMLEEIVDMILPKTDTPGAKELNVHRYVDEVMLTCEEADMQKKVLEGMEHINSASKSVAGKDFMDASAEERKTVLTSFDQEAFGKGEDEEHFFTTLKALTVAGFFSTEIGQTQILQHAPVPGKWVGCMPLAEAGNGKTWAQ